MPAVEVSRSYVALEDAKTAGIISWTGARWTGLTSALFCGMIVFTYSTCLHQEQCGTGPWNTISHSWEHPPGSYVSRLVVGVCCGMIGVFHGFLYLANTINGAEDTRGCCNCYTNEVLLSMGLVSVFCLSWVGAVCDAPIDPMCMGNNNVHSVCALSFFILTDLIAGAMAFKSPKTERAKRERVVSLFLFAGLSSFTFSRFYTLWYEDQLSDYWDHNGGNVTIVAELAEVATFLAFMNHTARAHFAGLRYGALLRGDSSWGANNNPPGGGHVASSSASSTSSSSSTTYSAAAAAAAGGPEGPFARTYVVLQSRDIARLSAGVLAATVALCLVVGVWDGTLDLGAGFPFLGDLGIVKPCNWFYRWVFVQFAHASMWVALFNQAALAGGPGSKWGLADSLVLAVQAFALLCLAGFGIMNKAENESRHDKLTVCFYVSANVAALASMALAEHRHAKRSRGEGSPQLAAAPGTGTALEGTKPPALPQALAAVAALSTLRFALAPPALWATAAGGGSGGGAGGLARAFAGAARGRVQRASCVLPRGGTRRGLGDRGANARGGRARVALQHPAR
mmetsp:Transcript_11107/g.26058  ORF Transcript_11107/g.26058 Transcript_11107/m.26058 type:complete len:568 (-) Transcript_11107:342-2045(-)